MLEVGQRWRWNKIGDVFIITKIHTNTISYCYQTGNQIGRSFDTSINQHLEYVNSGAVICLTPLMEALL